MSEHKNVCLQSDRASARKVARILFLESAKESDGPLIAARASLGVMDRDPIIVTGHPLMVANPNAGAGNIFPNNTKEMSLIADLGEDANKEFHLLLCKWLPSPSSTNFSSVT